MSSMSGPRVPEGQYPPFAVVAPNDHAAWIIIATALGLVCSLFFGGLRVLVRSAISDGNSLDDCLLYIATILATIQSSIIFGACSKGLGNPSIWYHLEDRTRFKACTMRAICFSSWPLVCPRSQLCASFINLADKTAQTRLQHRLGTHCCLDHWLGTGHRASMQSAASVDHYWGGMSGNSNLNPMK